MADIKLNLIVSSNGTTVTETQLAKKLAEQLERAQRAAVLRTSSNPPSSGGPSPAGGPAGAGGGSDYDRTRGLVGTGAAGRDFARQSEGLGGLVRVYATFAANIFAATTAFSALSKAVDTSNMVKGLDQLGAASGRNLSGLTKQLVIASDSAISFRDAMTATAQGTAGGLSGEQMIRLTVVAKNAAQALGRDMPDALSRLTKGIAKIEPELLDELGILVKVDAANVEYARSLGKTATSLSDLEKRQAFANAAITQGEKKFKDIELASNPYAKVLAATTNLSQSTLNLVNKVLSPVVELMSSSPTALTAVIAGLAALLLKQAIPALGQWRAGLRDAANASRDTANSINRDFRQFQTDLLSRNQPILAQQLATQEAAIAASRKAMDREAINSGRKLTAGMREVMSTPIAQVNQAQLDRLAREENALRTRAARFAQEAVDPARSIASQQSRAAQSADILKRAEDTKKYSQQLQAARTAESALAADRVRVQNELNKSMTTFSEGRQRQMVADRAENAAIRSNIVANASQNTQIMGMSAAYGKLTEETKKARDAARQAGQSFTGLAAAGTMVRGSFAIATAGVSGFLGAFMPWLIVIGLATAAIGALVEWLGTNNKKVKEFKSAIEGLNASTDSMGNTLDAINKKPFLERLTVASIKARSIALSDLATNVTKVFSTLSVADEMASEFDKFIDVWKSLWGGDLRSIATKSISASIAAGFKGATDGAARDKYKSAITGILGTEDTSSKGVFAALEKLDTPEDVLAVMDKLNVTLDKFAKETAKAAEPLINFSDSLEEVGKTANSLIAGLNLTDPMSKLGASVINLSNSMKKVVNEGPLNSIVSLKEILDTPSKSGFLPPEVFEKMLSLKSNVDSVHESLTTGISNIETYRKQLEKLAKINEGARKKLSSEGRGTQTLYAGEEKSIKEEEVLKQTLGIAEAALVNAREQEKVLALELAEINKSVFDYGAKAISIGVKMAGEQAALSISKAASSNIEGEGAAEVAYKLQLQEIDIQKQVIRGQMSVAQAMFLNSLAVERNTSQSKLNTIELKIANLENIDPTKFDAENKKLELEKRLLEKSIGVSDRVVSIIKNTSKSSDLLKQTRTEEPEVSQSLFGYAAPLAGGEAQLAQLAAQETIAANDKIIKSIKEQSDKKLKSIDLDIKKNAVLTETVAKSRESFSISEKEFQAETTRLNLLAKKMDNRKSEIVLETELLVLKTAQKQTGEAAASASLAISNKEKELQDTKILNANALLAITEDSNKKANESIRLQEESLARATIEASAAYGIPAEIIQAKLAAMDLEELKRKKATDAEIAAFQVKQQSIAYTAQYTTAIRELGFELDSIADIQTRITSLSDTMAKSFGKVGTAVGGIVKAFAKSSEDQIKIQEKLVKDKKKAEEKYAGDQVKIFAATEKLTAQAAIDREKAEVDSYANMAGAAKGFFSEKTFAFKAFAVIEQALTLQSMALQISALAVDTSTTAGYVANTMVKIGVSIKGAIANALNNVFPYNLIAAGVVVAAAAAFGLFGGGGSVPAAPSSEDRQKVQGTGQRYNSRGELESTGYGVLGDDEAKSESISKSIELLSEYAFEELEYSNKMLTALQNIETSLTGVSKGLVLTTGLLSGSAFGTVEGNQTKFGGSIFGGNKSTNISGTGISISGSVGGLAEGTGNLSQYESGSVTKKGGWFRSDKTTPFKNVTDLSKSVKDSLALTFSNIKTGLVLAGTAIGLGAEELTEKINAIPINVEIELRNLKGKELEEAVSAVLSATMDMITEKALEIVKPYQKMGEGLAETAFRVANTSRVIDLQLLSIGKVFGEVGLSSLEARMALVELSGGLEEFTSNADFFKQNFLSEAERLVPIQKAVTDELARLKLASIDSREKFKDLVLSLDLSKESNQELYVALMKLQKGFAEVYKEVESLALSAEDLAEAKLEQLSRVMELLGDKIGVTTAQRAKEIKSMDARLVPMQKWIYALEDEADAREALTSAYESEASSRQSSIDKLKESKKTIDDFSKSLTMGTQSPLTPGEKYSIARKEVESLWLALSDVSTTKEDKETIASKLPGAITSLLDLSKVFNASSEAYQNDYNYSKTILEYTSASIENQISLEEKSFKELQSQVSALGVLNDTAISIETAIIQMKLAIEKSNEAQLLTGPEATAQFVKSIYNSTPGLSASDTAGQEYWNSAITNKVVTASEAQGMITKEAMVRNWYLKHPDIKAEGDAASVAYWIKAINTSNDVKGTKALFAESVARDYNKPLRKIEAFKNGGDASGLAIVGEEGPELADFRNPARIYSNGNSGNILAEFGKEMAKEILELRKEVISLRADANRNAVILAESNITANANAANKVSNAIADTNSKTQWQERNQAVSY